MPKDSSAKYYQNNKERQQKSLMKNIEVIPKLVEHRKKYFEMQKNKNASQRKSDWFFATSAFKRSFLTFFCKYKKLLFYLSIGIFEQVISSLK